MTEDSTADPIADAAGEISEAIIAVAVVDAVALGAAAVTGHDDGHGD